MTQNLNGENLTDSLSEMMNLNLSDFSHNLKTSRLQTNTSSEMSEYYSSPSKSSTHDYSPPESSKFSSNGLVKDLNNNNTSLNQDESDAEGDKQITKLFVGNLPTSTTLPELLAVFRKYGPVNEALSVVKDHNYAFIHFYYRKDAEVALREVNDSLFKDRYIRVQFSTSQGFTNNKNRGLDKKRTFVSSPNANRQFVYPSQSSSFLSTSSLGASGNLFNKPSSRPITASRMSHSQSTVFYDKHSNLKPINNFSSPFSSLNSPSNLLIEASKFQNVKLNPYTQYHDELQEKQKLIQALYLRQQQQILQHQIQQQLQLQQLQQRNQEGLIASQFNRIPKSNTIGSFNFNAYNPISSNLANSLNQTLAQSRCDSASDQFSPAAQNMNNL